MNNQDILMAAIFAMQGKAVTTKWLMKHVDGIHSPQKAAGIMRIGIKQKLIDKYMGERSPVLYVTRDYVTIIEKD